MISKRTKNLFSGHDWVAACRFNELVEEEVLHEVARRLDTARKEKARPLVVLDLDSTLYEVAPRTFAIIQEWIKNAKQLPEKAHKSLSKLKMEHVGYSLKDTFHKIGLDVSEKETNDALVKLKEFWWDRFFSNLYLPHDRTYPGATQFVQRLYHLGASIVYLTGRESGKMREGTLKNLERDGFPIHPEKTSLFMKTESHLSDTEYKKKAALQILEMGTVVACFENEPQNVVTLFETFPDALHVFMYTVFSDAPAKPIHGIYKIRGFHTKK